METTCGAGLLRLGMMRVLRVGRDRCILRVIGEMPCVGVVRCATNHKDVSNTVVSMRAKSGVWERVVECKDLGGLCARENLELSSQRIEHKITLTAVRQKQNAVEENRGVPLTRICLKTRSMRVVKKARVGHWMIIDIIRMICIG